MTKSTKSTLKLVKQHKKSCYGRKDRKTDKIKMLNFTWKILRKNKPKEKEQNTMGLPCKITTKMMINNVLTQRSKKGNLTVG